MDQPDQSTTTETVIRTVVLELETSASKIAQVQKGIKEFQSMASYMADLIVTVPESDWQPQNNTLYRMVTREFDDRLVKATTAREAAQHVAEAFSSWQSRGKQGKRPKFGNGTYLLLSHQDFDIEQNNGKYGLKARFIPHNGIWFGINDSPYSRDFLKRVCDSSDDATTGSCELHLADDGSLQAHLVIKWDVEVIEPNTADSTLGVDLGENVIYAVALIDSGEIADIQLESGKEFRHYRERLKKKRSHLMERGDLRGVRKCRNEHERYTEQVLDTASREIAELAKENQAVIALEDLTHYRTTAADPIHDWPYAALQEKIAYKATAEGIPVETIDPRGTSITCRKCGQTNREYRDGADFECFRCGYEVHADVNAAINLATRLEDIVLNDRR
ncbi:RNA-guided endonuclease TnpB family protein [Natrinema hispanicum]|uniref:Transposase, IS605 OrfB family, central region n=1 Tax=Natrinema hispanicum TaxID=392421 RepID=A0A1I0IXW6_9EURY|nr:RNA-guided endonuclease TnpB family protein [Natrinema hispanicum]SEU01434.1 transposase, IS605 OrfB family, central region [Natrinema hispanicum]